MNMDTAEVINAIDTMNKEQLKTVNEAVRDRNNILVQREVRTYKKGARVAFEDKHGRTVIGIIDRINTKSVSLHEEDNTFKTWRVHPSFLREAPKKND